MWYLNSPVGQHDIVVDVVDARIADIGLQCSPDRSGSHERQRSFEVFSQRYERGTSNLPFVEWTEVFGSERLTGALLDRLTHHVDILEMNGDSYRLKHSKKTSGRQLSD